MKTLLFASLLFLGVATLAPQAEAHDRRVRVIRYHDHCGYPVYGYVNSWHRHDYGRHSDYRRHRWHRDHDYRRHSRVRYHEPLPRFGFVVRF